MRVCVVGTGYVGLVTAACLAETGTEVTGADVDSEKIGAIEAGVLPIFEPGLDDLVQRNRAAGRLTFTNRVEKAVADADVVFIAVGTPSRGDGGADLRAVDAVALTVKEHASRELVLVAKSTVPVGTNARLRSLVAGSRHPIHVVSNPEFLKEGDAIADFMRPDRIVIGCDLDDRFACDLMSRLYHPVSLNHEKIVWMRAASAELTKYVANTMLAMRVSFMNEVASLCEMVGADVHEVRHGVGSDTRIGSKFLYAGPGYGGSCFPKDVKALVHSGRELGMELELAATTDRVNQRQKGVLLRKLRQELRGELRGRRIAIWGISFKPRTDDCRESPALALIDALLAEGASVFAHDPEAAEAARKMYGDKITLVQDAYSACNGADALVLVTEWREYQNPDFARVSRALRQPIVIDGRNIWSTYDLEAHGLRYTGVGVQGATTRGPSPTAKKAG